MKSKSSAIILSLGALFAANMLLAQDASNRPDDLAPEEAAAIQSSEDAEKAFEIQNQETEGFVPAPDSDILTPSVEFEIENEASPNLVLDNGDIGQIYSADESNNDLADRKIIISTPHRKREIDPAKKADLVELSRIFGVLHAVRTACNGASDQTYRSKMASMIDLEAPASSYIREPLIIAFNFGFREHGSGNGTCNSDKNAALEAQFAKMGRKYALKLAAFYSSSLPIRNKN